MTLLSLLPLARWALLRSAVTAALQRAVAVTTHGLEKTSATEVLQVPMPQVPTTTISRRGRLPSDRGWSCCLCGHVLASELMF